MRWKGRRKSTNVEDRRGRGPAGPKLAIGGGMGVLVVVVMLLLGVDPSQLLGTGGQTGTGTQRQTTPEEEERVEFVKVVLADTEDVWGRVFTDAGLTYRQPKLVVFTGRVQSACGLADSGVGPFYCPADESIYLDVSFFTQMRKQLGAPGDFAQAYVIAHEVGHHVQKLLGDMQKVHRARGKVSQREYNALSVRLELQADFYAGLFAHHGQRMKRFLEEGDLEEAINAAKAIGDDTLQRRGRGYVEPETFTHGSSAQRVAWFRRGLETGDLRAGNTFDDALFDRVAPK
ncbi:MAG: neutral zinc metallopeptidase [Planctomycetota bacterium]|nr:neutral zinc metallopeptidase [Planctomycetota bacterium]